MATERATDGVPTAPRPAKPPSVMGYFRRLFQENPDWLYERSNARIVERWLRDHPGETAMPRNVLNTLANLKSSLRRRLGKRRPGHQVETLAGAARVRGPKALSGLEAQIDDCLTFARGLDPTGLDHVILLLRRARNAVIRKAGGTTR